MDPPEDKILTQDVDVSLWICMIWAIHLPEDILLAGFATSNVQIVLSQALSTIIIWLVV